jgi:hypothetical protein
MCNSLGQGGTWYLNPKNYSNRMYKLREPGKKPTEALGNSPKANGELDTFNQIIGEMNRRALMRPGGQVVPLHEVFEVLDMGMPVAAMMCICRKNTRACEECSLSEYTCMVLGTGMLKWERWPERYRGGVVPLDQAGQGGQYWIPRA